MVKKLPVMQETTVWSLGQVDPWRREWLPTPVFLPGELHGQRNLVAYSPWDCKELDMAERLTLSLFNDYTTVWIFLIPLNCTLQFSRSVVSDSLQPHGLQHARLPWPLPTPRVYSYSCPLSRWCHPTISSSVVPFSSCLQSFPASGFFPVIQLLASDGQSIGVSASTSVLPMNTQNWSPLGWTGQISLQSKGLSRVFFNTIVQKYQFFDAQLFFYRPILTSMHDYWKTHSFD